MTTRLRSADSDDLALLVDFVKAYHEFEQTPPFDEDSIRQSLQPLLLSSELGRIWLIEQAGQAIGYIALCFCYSLEFRGRDAFVDEFFIVSEQRGKGIGKTVLMQVQKEAKKLGIKALHLEVGRNNERAQRLYKALGFQAREGFLLMSQRLDADSN